MEKELLRRVQLEMLKIAVDVKKVCDENDIDYFLDSGTLIGAVRHDGFIPWDDDLDIGMLRKDYEKFLQLAPECLGNKYFVQSLHTDDKYALPFAKIRKVGTRYVEATSENTHSHEELFIDVLPYDNYPINAKLQKRMKRNIKNILNILMMKSGVKPWLHHKNKTIGYISKIKYFPYMIAKNFFSRATLIMKLDKEMKKYNNTECESVVEQFGSNVGKYIIPRSCFSEYIDKDFEGESFKIPKDYHTLLTNIYGDYMVLPPVEERENRHQIKEVKI